MAYDIIPILILIGCVVGLAVVIGRKLPGLRMLDVSTIHAEQELRLKQRLLATRLRRRLATAARAMQTIARPLTLTLLSWVKRSYQRILELESHYKKPATAAGNTGGTSLDDLFAEAQRLRGNGETAAAEEKLIQAIGLDPRHVPAYELLGEIYLETRDFAKAREVYAYLCKVLRRGKNAGNGAAHRLAACHLNLATAHQEMGRHVQALQAARRAVTLEPSNPRTLDFLLKISIVVKDKALAKKTWEALKQTDPDNAKLEELREQISQLP